MGDHDNGTLAVLERLKQSVVDAKSPTLCADLLDAFDHFAIDSMPWSKEIWAAVERMRSDFRNVEESEMQSNRSIQRTPLRGAAQFGR